MPGGLTLLASLNVAIPTPPANKVTIYFSTDLNTPAYKDSAGVVHTLVGTTGPAGTAGPAILNEDGLDGIDGFNIPVPGAAGATGATGSAGPIGPAFLVQDGIDGEDGVPGPPGTSPAGSTSPVLEASIVLTDAQFRALAGTPIQVVAAPGSGFVIVPLLFEITMNITATFSANTNINLRYGTSGATTGISAFTLTINVTGKRIGYSAGPASQNVSTTNLDNNAIQVFNSSSPTGGSTSNGFLVKVQYIVVAIQQ